MKKTQIKNILVVDPFQKKNLIKETLYIEENGVFGNFSPENKYVSLDCENLIALAGGVDLHTHIGGGKTNIARMLMPNGINFLNEFGEDDSSSCTLGTLETGFRYAEMGYTAAFEPAMIFPNARQAHLEMGDIPILDHGAYVMLGNDEMFLKFMAEKKSKTLIRDYIGWCINASRAMGVKVVNPGGISAFKFNQRSLNVDENHTHWGISPREIIFQLASSLTELKVPHPLHIHASNLGVPGNIKSTLETIDALDGLPGHLTHVQFHSYGNDGPKKFSSASLELIEKLKKNKNISIDVGQIIFGQTVTESGDTMKQFANRHNSNPKKWVMGDIECHAGCGVVPFKYREKSFVNALQWVIGLEIFLLIDDPWQVVLTTDHPNGGPFTSYPHLIKLLMDKSFRDEQLSMLHPEIADHCVLKDINKELSIYEIAIMTRSAPVKILGLERCGSLAPGYNADLVLYEDDLDREYMFSNPKYVFKDGEVVVASGKLVSAPKPGIHYLDVDFDSSIEKEIKKYYQENCVGEAKGYQISEEELQLILGGGSQFCRKTY